MMHGDLIASLVDGRIVIDRADPYAMISNTLWNACLAGYCHDDVYAGEGILVIHAANGTFRYDLTGERDQIGSWYMRRRDVA